MRYRDRLTLTLILIATLFMLSTVEDDAHAQQQCGLPPTIKANFASLMYWTERGSVPKLKSSYDQTIDWYAGSGQATHAGPHLGSVLAITRRMKENVPAGEWVGLGLDVDCPNYHGATFRGYCREFEGRTNE